MTSPHSRLLFFGDEETARIIMALLNSSLFYLWFTTYSDGFHLAHSLVTAFPCSQELLARGKGDDNALIHIAIKLEADLLAHTRLSTRNKRISPLSTMGESEPQDRHAIELTEYQVSFSKGIIDEIDRYLAHSYDLTKEELDFIITYDQKYRARQAKDRSRI